MTSDFTPGTRVRISIRDESDPGHDLFHGRKGIVLAHLGTTNHLVRPDLRGEHLYRVKLDDQTIAVFVQSDLQSVFQLLRTVGGHHV